MSNIRTTRLFLSLALAGLVAAASHPARAADTQTVSIIVKAGDLNLRSSAGQQALHHRIALAALKVCAEAFGGDLSDDCVQQARRGAAPQERALVAAAQGASQVAAADPAR